MLFALAVDEGDGLAGSLAFEEELVAQTAFIVGDHDDGNELPAVGTDRREIDVAVQASVMLLVERDVVGIFERSTRVHVFPRLKRHVSQYPLGVRLTRTHVDGLRCPVEHDVPTATFAEHGVRDGRVKQGVDEFVNTVGI